eukprot:1144966-Pelagomonas_calceolata.AAC.5
MPLWLTTVSRNRQGQCDGGFGALCHVPEKVVPSSRLAVHSCKLVQADGFVSYSQRALTPYCRQRFLDLRSLKSCCCAPFLWCSRPWSSAQLYSGSTL